ncbi:hypothetical protein TYRP_009725 [Tyrophagus putrescentiae]|nr:hypothetical protein TYRP_009725 [Tyrophagus putrescentiae]
MIFEVERVLDASKFLNPTGVKGGETCACVVCVRSYRLATPRFKNGGYSRSYLSKSSASRRLTDSALFP